MSARGVALAVVALVALVGCGGSSPAVHVVRPAHPVWCPAEVKLRGRVQHQPGRFDARGLLGLAQDDAVRLGAAHDCTVRVTNASKDEVLTMDLRSDRVDVMVEHGRIARFDPNYGPIG